MKILFSGIRPTGLLHLGNYFGAIKNWVELQDKYQCIFEIVDYHALTTPFDPKTVKKEILEMATELLACGIDPKKSILTVQSQIPEQTELAWILGSITPLGMLERMPTYKEKKEQFPDNLNLALLSYPVLMAADILAYKAEAVPVGEDQDPHLEFCRFIAERFNKRFGNIFPETKTLKTESPRIIGLDGKSKMSKTLNNFIGLFESQETIEEKLKGAFTDPQKIKKGDPGHPEKCNIFSLHQRFSLADLVKTIEKDCGSGILGCAECKKILGQNIAAKLGDIRTKYEELKQKPEEVENILQDGAVRAREIAGKNLQEVREKIGVR
ncbi:MAG: tryptophan--tRNA ligase [bacterium]|nr:tryptophan--tRNA ligase [bacterium]